MKSKNKIILCNLCKLYLLCFCAIATFMCMNTLTYAMTESEVEIMQAYTKVGQSVNDITRTDVISCGNLANRCFCFRLPTTIQTRDMIGMVTAVDSNGYAIQCDPYLCFYRDSKEIVNLSDMPRDKEFMGDTLRVCLGGSIPLGDLHIIVNFNNCHYVNSKASILQQKAVGNYCMIKFNRIDSNEIVNDTPMFALNFKPDSDCLDGRKHSLLDKDKFKDVKLFMGTIKKPEQAPEMTITSKKKQETLDKIKAKEDVTPYIKKSNSIVHEGVPATDSVSYMTSPVLNSSKEDLQYVILGAIILCVVGYQLKLREK